MSFIVQVTFSSSSRRYSYYCPFKDVAVGDTVIVDTPNSGLTKVRVEGIEQSKAGSPWLKPVIAVGSDRNVRKVMAELEATKAKAEREATIIKRLREIETTIEQIARWTALARKSPEAKRLLAELKRISK